MKIYIADDYKNFRLLIADALRQDGAEVSEFADGASLLGAALAVPPRLILTDFHLPHVSALDVLEHLRAENILAPMIVMTGEPREAVPIDEARLGPVHVMQKPFLLEELRAIIAALTESGT